MARAGWFIVVVFGPFAFVGGMGILIRKRHAALYNEAMSKPPKRGRLDSRELHAEMGRIAFRQANATFVVGLTGAVIGLVVVALSIVL